MFLLDREETSHQLFFSFVSLFEEQLPVPAARYFSLRGNVIARISRKRYASPMIFFGDQSVLEFFFFRSSLTRSKGLGAQNCCCPVRSKLVWVPKKIVTTRFGSYEGAERTLVAYPHMIIG
jgi:hypothetical protein